MHDINPNDEGGYSAELGRCFFADGGVLATDDEYVAYLSDGGSAWVYSTMLNNAYGCGSSCTSTPLVGTPISPAIVGGSSGAPVVVIAEECPSGTTCGGSTTPVGFATFVLGSDGTPTQVDYDSMTVSGTQYETLNSITVDNTHSPARVYILAAAVCTLPGGGYCLLDAARQGAILSYDIQTASGGTYPVGTILNNRTASPGPAVTYSFPGPSGSSPVIIPGFSTGLITGNALFFDGLTHAAGSSPTSSSACLPLSGYSLGSHFSGCYYGIIDTSAGTSSRSTATEIWANIYPKDQFQAGAGLDPRWSSGTATGGLWVFPVSQTQSCTSGVTDPTQPLDNCLISLNPYSGYLIGSSLSVANVVNGLDGGGADDVYIPSSAVMVSTTSTDVYLTVAAEDLSQTNPRVTNFAVTSYNTGSSTFSPVGNWVTPEGGPFDSAALGQFVTVNYTDGSGHAHNQTVFTGYGFGPYAYGY